MTGAASATPPGDGDRGGVSRRSVAGALRDALTGVSEVARGTAPTAQPPPTDNNQKRTGFFRAIRSLAGSRGSLRRQFALGIGTAVLFPLLASAVALVAFFRVSTLQREINSEYVPALTRAVQIGQLAARLAGAAPALVAAAQERGDDEGDAQGIPSPGDAESGGQLMEHAARMIELSSGMAASERTQSLQAFSEDLASNLRDIQVSVNTSVALQEKEEAIRERAAVLTQRLSQVSGAPLDDQLFYMATGLRNLDDSPAPPAVRGSEAEVRQIAALGVLDSRASLALSLLNDATVLRDFARLDTVEEQFVAATDAVERALATLGPRAPPQLGEIVREVTALGLGEDGAFPVHRAYLTETRNQVAYLERNVQITESLEAAVTSLTIGLEVDALFATEGSETALNLGRLLLVGLNIIGIACAGVVLWILGRRVIARLTRLSSAMRRMAEGDLETEVRTRGSDEVAVMGQALEVFRRHALEVQRLNLVEELAKKVEAQNEKLENTLADLRRAQDQMVMQEKLASLGQLTAGIAHEIKNPLNFVNNFADISVSLIEDLNAEIDDVSERIPEDSKEEIKDISADLTGNMERIVHHGKRASSIVYGMLEHSRKEAGDSRPTDINGMLEEFLALAFHSMRAEDNTFQMTIRKDLGSNVGEIEAVPQDLSRVFLNIVTNACQATLEKQHADGVDPAWEPLINVRSRRENGTVEVRIRDNGPGIPDKVKARLFEPFFTTKEGTKGTGLGLSLAYDIVRSHGGELAVESEVGIGTEFTITLPDRPPPAA